MEKPDVLHILYSGLGGTNDYVFNLIRGDVSNSVRHHIVFFGVEDIPEGNLKFGEKISSSVRAIKKKPGLDKNAINELKEIITQKDPIAVTLHVNSLILSLSKILRPTTKLVFVEHQANHLKTRKEWLWSAIAQKKADYIVCLTPEYQAQLSRKLRFLYDNEKNIVIPTGLALDDYKSERKDHSGPLKIGMISRINAFRDHKTLLEAFDSLKNDEIELHIAGDGPLMGGLQQEFQNKKVFWQGMLNREEIIEFLSSLDIYVHASFGETSSIAIMQAQASGLPIIASDVPGINNVLNAENSILVEPENVVTLENAMNKLIENEDLRSKLSKASMDYTLKNLDNHKMFNQYKELIQ